MSFIRESAPLVIGPNHECLAVCLVCLAPCDPGLTCGGCGYPVCGGCDHDNTLECELLARGPTPAFPDPGAKSEAGRISTVINISERTLLNSHKI